eukprot:Gb_40966 [translate_table: standard]
MVTIFSLGYSFESNNIVEYEGLLKGLHLARTQGVDSLSIRGDSNIVIKHFENKWKVNSWALEDKRNKAKSLMNEFNMCNFSYI